MDNGFFSLRTLKTLIAAHVAMGALASCTTSISTVRGITIDQTPMYGGIDRQANPILRAADEQFISGVVKEFGSREVASERFVEQGVRFYQLDDYSKAMKRFNQAWLLNSRNPGAFWGFAMVDHDQGNHCDARRMIEKSFELGLKNPIALADAGRIYTLCAVSDNPFAADKKHEYLAQSDQLYQQAISQSPNNDYIFGSWATALYWRGDYAGAWDMIAKQRAAGGTPMSGFLMLLREKMPEPR